VSKREVLSGGNWTWGLRFLNRFAGLGRLIPLLISELRDRVQKPAAALCQRRAIDKAGKTFHATLSWFKSPAIPVSRRLVRSISTQAHGAETTVVPAPSVTRLFGLTTTFLRVSSDSISPQA